MNTIFWKGVFSTTIEGLLISELPPISKPPLRVKETTIDGRDGSIIEDLGYEPYNKPVTISLRGNFNINKVIKYFTGEGEIIFSNEPDKVYTAKVISQIDYNRLLRYRTAVVTFRVQPFKHKYNEVYKETQTATAPGTSIVVTDSAEANLKAFSIYGKSTQNGTPAPDAPVDIVSLCADGTIAVTANDTTVDLSVVNGLRGIPVKDKNYATYTDASGQMWCADEIDLERGVYIQRVIPINAGEQYWTINTTWSGVNTDCNIAYFKHSNMKYGDFLCTHFSKFFKNSGYDWVVGKMGMQETGVMYASIAKSAATTNDGVKQYMASLGAVIYCVAVTPIETALTAEQIAVCKALKANHPTTTFLNDENAYMKVQYIKHFEVFNEGLEASKPIMVLRGSGSVGISVNGIHIFDYTFPEGETEVVIDSEKEDAYLGEVLKNRNMNGEFPVLLAGTNKIEWSGDVESIEILPRSRWL